jgi:hypothetical protein
MSDDDPDALQPAFIEHVDGNHTDREISILLLFNSTGIMDREAPNDNHADADADDGDN